MTTLGSNAPEFTHLGWFCGLVPVYMTDPDQEAPTIMVRWWCPELVLDAVHWLFDAFCWCAEQIGADLPEGFPIVVTGRIQGSGQ